MFAKLQNETVSFVMSFHLSIDPFVHMKLLGSYWTEFYDIWYLGTFRQSVKKIQLSLKCDKNSGYYT